MQVMFVDDTPWQAPWARRVMPAIIGLVEHAPSRTLFSRFIPARNTAEAPGTWRRYFERWEQMTLNHLPADQVELVPELAAYAPPASVVDKRTYSPWHDGRLAPALSAKGVTTLIISGLETEVCVLSTLLGAVDYGFRVIIATDAVCSSTDETHDAMQRIYESRFGMQVEPAEVEDILAAWERD